MIEVWLFMHSHSLASSASNSRWYYPSPCLVPLCVLCWSIGPFPMSFEHALCPICGVGYHFEVIWLMVAYYQQQKSSNIGFYFKFWSLGKYQNIIENNAEDVHEASHFFSTVFMIIYNHINNVHQIKAKHVVREIYVAWFISLW